jgi:hypothetical protein
MPKWGDYVTESIASQEHSKKTLDLLTDQVLESFPLLEGLGYTTRALKGR